jgi:diguanylate cyclase (GGDEF)-like protein
MFIDLDDFKALNDTYGHSVGDHLLRLVASKLSKFVHSPMLAARLGGDEFVVMWPRISADAAVTLKSATALAHEIRRTLSESVELFSLDGGRDHEQSLQYKITASMGVALFGDKVEPVTEALKRADVAMYQSKMAGKNAVSIFDQQVQSAINARVALSTDLNSALLNEQLEVHYQLQSTMDGFAVGAECLLRWRHPVRGMVSPVEFISIAEESGAINEIGDWVIQQACSTLARWSKAPGTASLTLSVNVSPRQFNDQDFHLRVEALLRQAGVSASKLCLEITEGIVLNDADNVIEKMKELVDSGLSFSIDDFGTGYSSLSYLQRLPLRELKIDKSFINNLDSDSNSEAIVRAIIALGLSMQIHVLAEGVETEEQRMRLKELGCERIQGYFLARPMALDAMEHRLLQMGAA